MNIGEILKNLRLSNNLKQEDVANAIGINRTTYAYYEIDHRFPNRKTLVKLSNFFGVSVDFLLTGKEQIDREIQIYEYLDVITNLNTNSDSLFKKVDSVRKTIMFPKKQEDYFLFKVTNPSMITSRINIEDILLCKKDSTLTNGAICVALVNNETTILGKVILTESNIILQPVNITCSPYIFSHKDLNQNIKIAGYLKEGIYSFENAQNSEYSTFIPAVVDLRSSRSKNKPINEAEKYMNSSDDQTPMPRIIELKSPSSNDTKTDELVECNNTFKISETD